MTLPGPSSLGRIAACPSSEALPHVRSSSQHTERGDVVHAFLATCVFAGRERALELAPEEYREALEAIPMDRLPPLDPRHSAAEVSFALDIQRGTAREAGRNLKREEARALARAGEMIGTADLVGLTATDVVVHDWKSGRGHVDRAQVNWQVKTYALMAARCYGLTAARASIVRVLDDGGVWYDTVEMDALDLDAHEAELRALMELAAQVKDVAPEHRPPLHEGSHCRHCPALPFCPAKMTLLTTAFAPGEPLAAVAEGLTAERAASAWAKIETAEKLLERLKAIVKDFARQAPFPTSDGYVVGEVTKHREAIIPARAKGPLEHHLGAQLGGVVYSESVETETAITKARLKSALGKYVLPTIPNGKITHVEKDILDVLRKSGAISVSSFKTVEEHKPKPAETGGAG